MPPCTGDRLNVVAVVTEIVLTVTVKAGVKVLNSSSKYQL